MPDEKYGSRKTERFRRKNRKTDKNFFEKTLGKKARKGEKSIKTGSRAYKNGRRKGMKKAEIRTKVITSIFQQQSKPEQSLKVDFSTYGFVKSLKNT